MYQTDSFTFESLNSKPNIRKYVVTINFNEGATLNLQGPGAGNFLIEFYDRKNGHLVYDEIISNSMTSKTKVRYFVNYYIKITDLESDEVFYEYNFNLKGQQVYIHFDTKALGDTIAWLPSVEEFSVLHQCKVIVSTNYNSLFEKKYPNLTFVDSIGKVKETYASYGLGLYHDAKAEGYRGAIDIMRNPSDFRDYSIRKVAAEILGLAYRPLRPRIEYDETKSIPDKYVCIAPHGSTFAKYWHYPQGWQQVIDHLNAHGYKVVLLSSEPLGKKQYDDRLGGKLTGVINKTGYASLNERASDIKNAELFIGLGSGLSWLAWAVEAKIILISGFSAPYTEFPECERIFTPDKRTCNSCFNRVRLDLTYFDWCHFDVNSPRRFECSKTITAQMVIEKINKQLKIKD